MGIVYIKSGTNNYSVLVPFGKTGYRTLCLGLLADPLLSPNK